MDEIIQKIMDSERMAQNLIAEANQEQQYHEEKMLSEVEAYRVGAFQANDAKIASFAEGQNEEATSAVRSIEAAAKKRISHINTITEAKRNDWINHLFQKILDGEIG